MNYAVFSCMVSMNSNAVSYLEMVSIDNMVKNVERYVTIRMVYMKRCPMGHVLENVSLYGTNKAQILA